MAVTVYGHSAIAGELAQANVEFPEGKSSIRLPGVNRTENQLSVIVRINDGQDDLRFLFDTGAGRTLLDRRIAHRIGLRATEKTSFGGVGAGRVDADVVKSATLQLGELRVKNVDLDLVDDVHETDAVGIIGYDLLCSTVVMLDYKKPSILVTSPSTFQYRGGGEILPLTFKGKWPYVQGTLKVPGVEPITDNFLVDTGSEDAVNHPIIRQSKGRLRETRTGAGGFGESVAGVIGPNEWFKLGRSTIPSTTSACCAGNEDVDRQIGGAVLSRFRIIFDYPESKIIFERD